jgi:hypothetical protein
MSKEQKIIQGKLGLLKLAKTLGSVSDACKIMGYQKIMADNEFELAKTLKCKCQAYYKILYKYYQRQV